MTGFILAGALIACAGLAVLIAGLRAPVGEPKRAAMMIGGMMATAFGIVIAGFAIAWQATAPLDLNASSVPTP